MTSAAVVIGTLSVKSVWQKCELRYLLIFPSLFSVSLVFLVCLSCHQAEIQHTSFKSFKKQRA